MSNAATSQIKKSFKKLEAQAESFASAFLVSDPRIRYLAKLPFPRMAGAGGNDAAQNVLDMGSAEDRYTVISHKSNCDDERGTVAKLLSRLDYEEDQDRKSTLRLPGLVLVDDEVVSKARDFNFAKKEFKKAMGELPANFPRADIKSAVECCFLHAYRNILVIDEPVESIGFSWASVNHSVKRITVKDLREQIGSYYISPTGTGDEAEDELGDVGGRMLALISQLPENEILAIKRPVKPHVKVNYKLYDSGWKSADGSMPVLISKSASEDIKSVSELSVATRKRAPRESVYSSEPIIERLHCYQYAEPQYA